MRKALHIHMLVQLLGMSHPEDLFQTGFLADTFRRVWYFVASISFRSTEAFAAYLNEPAAFEELHSLPLLPLTPKQRGMIGEARVHESFRAQLRARNLQSLPPCLAQLRMRTNPILPDAKPLPDSTNNHCNGWVC